MSLNNQLRYNKGKAKKLEETMKKEEEEESKNNREDKDEKSAIAKNTPSSSSKNRKRKRRIGGSSSAFPSSLQKANKMLVDRPKERFSDLGGISRILQDVRELIEYPLQHPEIYSHLGVEPPRGILLHGPPGCGKTMMANAIAGEINVPFFKISAPEIVSGMSGESEEKIRNLFDKAAASAPSIIFIDEIDAITPKRETSARGMERRMVAQLLTCLDNLTLEATSGKAVIVIGATNRPQSLDTALRRAGRFDREICMPVPDTESRVKILKVMTGKMRTEGNFDFKIIAKKTPGFVGADLKALTKEAAVVAVNRVFKELQELQQQQQHRSEQMEQDDKNYRGRSNSIDERAAVSTLLRSQIGTLNPQQLEDLYVTMEDFMKAVKKVQPSAKREGFATVPNVSWKDIGALQNVRAELKMSILEPIRDPERFEAVGLSIPAGVLLFGPPGCGKTLLAKAIANESGANFISVKGPELLDKYVGESERAVRHVFQRARMSSPCVIFFDELDALCPRRDGSGGGGGSGVSERVVNQLLTELDGLESRRNVFVIAATNRPDIIDPAMLRPGRLDKLLYVPLPAKEDRLSILQTLSRKAPFPTGAKDSILTKVAASPSCEGYSGADLQSLVREATLIALGRTPEGEKTLVTESDFDIALQKILPSVSKRDEKVYNKLRKRLRQSRSNVTNISNSSRSSVSGDSTQNNTK
jgi:ribosome biogenesis ATPase